MKSRFLLAALTLSSLFCPIQAEEDPVLMKINGQEIRKSEFEYIYHKNSQQQMAEQKSLDEYLDLFINFKLKVAAAEAQGIDTTKAFLNEFNGYRRQLAQPYLVDRTVDNKLALEAYNRLKENVEVSHILLRLDPNATQKETSEVYTRIMAAKKKIEKGYDFNKLAKEISEDPSAKQNGGYLGYISGFMTVYPFESAAYNTPVGKISEPVRTTFGYHLVKVLNRRQDPGEVHVAHIMKMVPRNADNKTWEEKRREIDTIYSLLQKGADFAELAKEKSDDKNSGLQGGLLPWFGTGRMIPSFEKEAFLLKEMNSYTKPFRTEYGWHIAKLIDRRGLAPFEEKKAEILKRIARDERGSMGHDALIEKLKVEYHFAYNENGESLLRQLAKQQSPMDSAFQATVLALSPQLLFSFADKQYTTTDFIHYLEKNSVSNKSDNQVILDQKLKAFSDKSLLAYEDTQLESKYLEFRNLVREYHDGILLFDISNKEVWEKASKDTEGLQKYFKKNKKDYKWPAPRFKGYVVECKNDSVLNEARKLIRKAPSDSIAVFLNRAFNNDTVKLVKVQKGLFAKGDNSIVDKQQFKSSQNQKSTTDEKFPVAFLQGKKLKKPKTYEDVRGLVTADYQTYLESLWIKQLRAQSKIEINQDVLKTVKAL